MRPNSNSLRLRFISLVRVFIRSLSCLNIRERRERGHLEADDDVGSPVLALGHHLNDLELIRHLLKDVVHDHLNFLLSRRGGATSVPRLSGLKLKDRFEKSFGSRREKSNLSVGMETVQVWRLLRQMLVHVSVVAGVVGVGRGREPESFSSKF